MTGARLATADSAATRIAEEPVPTHCPHLPKRFPEGFAQGRGGQVGGSG